jgi:hypothetical protein
VTVNIANCAAGAPQDKHERKLASSALSTRTVEQNDGTSTQVQKIVRKLRDLVVEFGRVVQDVHQLAENYGEQGLWSQHTENGMTRPRRIETHTDKRNNHE